MSYWAGQRHTIHRNLMETVDIFKSKGGRFCCSYFYAKFFSKRRKSRDIPGTSANQTRRLPLTADQLFRRIRKGLPDAVCSQQHGATFATVVFFAKKIRLLISKTKRKTYKKYPFGIKFHSVFVIALGIKFRKIYIFFLFYFQNFGGSLPASSSASTRCTDIKKGTHPLLFFLPAMLIIIRKTIKKRSGI